MKKLLILAASAAAVSLLGVSTASAGDCSSSAAATQNIVETAENAGSFTTLVSLLQRTGLDKTLSAEGPFTVFAPTDEAFSKVPKETLNALQNDKEQLKSVLTYHVVSGSVPASKVVGLSSATTVQGTAVNIDASKGVKIDSATVTQTDIEASNGLIHVIDTVLIPKS